MSEHVAKCRRGVKSDCVRREPVAVFRGFIAHKWVPAIKAAPPSDLAHVIGYYACAMQYVADSAIAAAKLHSPHRRWPTRASYWR